MRHKELYGNAAAFLTILVWGVTFVSTKELLADFTAPEILVIRFALGWLALCAIPGPGIHFCGVKTEMLFALAGFSGVTLYFLLENIALVFTLASNVGVIVATSPFFTALLAWMILHAEKPGRNFYLGFMLAITGIGLISFGGGEVAVNPLGDALAVLAAMAWAVYSVTTRKLGMLGYGSLAATRRIFFYGLLFMAPLAIPDSFAISMEELLLPRNLFNLLFLGLGASAICFVTWTYTLKCLGAARASAYIYLVPVVTIISAAIVLGEELTVTSATGSVLAICGLLVSEIRFGRGKHLAV